MRTLRQSIPALTLWGALGISCFNIIAAIIGFNPALIWIINIAIWPVITAIIAAIIIWRLILSWLGSFMGNHVGMLIYYCNLILAPFGYHSLGIPWWLGITFAAAPLPFYFGMMRLSMWIDSLSHQKT